MLFSGGTGSNVVQWLDKLCIAGLSWVLPINPSLIILHPQGIIPVIWGLLRGKGKIPPLLVRQWLYADTNAF